MRPNDTHATKPHALAHATLIISGESVEPEFWTSFFGIQPSRTITKGKPYMLPSGRMSPRPGKLGLWAVESRPAVESDALSPHLRYIKSYLGLPRIQVRELMQAQGANLALWCYWDNASGDRVPDVPADIRAMMDEMGGTIEIDEYK
jgi:hypothetical protein